MKLEPRLLMLEVASRPLYWLMLGASLAVLLRGHNEPGGGFIAGLLAASASVLWAVAVTPAAAARRLPLGTPQRLGALGVAVAAASGLPGVLAFGPIFPHTPNLCHQADESISRADLLDAAKIYARAIYELCV